MSLPGKEMAMYTTAAAHHYGPSNILKAKQEWGFDGENGEWMLVHNNDVYMAIPMKAATKKDGTLKLSWVKRIKEFTADQAREWLKAKGAVIA